MAKLDDLSHAHLDTANRARGTKKGILCLHTSKNVS